MKIGEKLPDFPVVRADRTTTKTRIVFDASAKFRGKSFNSEALSGLKVQADMFSILVRFRKELVSDLSQTVSSACPDPGRHTTTHISM